MAAHKVMITYANPNRLSEILNEISPFAITKNPKQRACFFLTSLLLLRPSLSPGLPVVSQADIIRVCEFV